MTERQIIETLATKVMEWELDNRYFVGATRHECFLLPDGSRVLRKNWNPPQNIADAMQVLRKLGEYRLYKEDGMPVICVIWKYNVVGKGETEEAAIVDAALKAVA